MKCLLLIHPGRRTSASFHVLEGCSMEPVPLKVLVSQTTSARERARQAREKAAKLRQEAEFLRRSINEQARTGFQRFIQ